VFWRTLPSQDRYVLGLAPELGMELGIELGMGLELVLEHGQRKELGLGLGYSVKETERQAVGQIKRYMRENLN
jgi:hypothetical protein